MTTISPENSKKVIASIIRNSVASAVGLLPDGTVMKAQTRGLSGENYNTVNAVILSSSAAVSGFSDSRWFTREEVAALGGRTAGAGTEIVAATDSFMNLGLTVPTFQTRKVYNAEECVFPFGLPAENSQTATQSASVGIFAEISAAADSSGAAPEAAELGKWMSAAGLGIGYALSSGNLRALADPRYAGVADILINEALELKEKLVPSEWTAENLKKASEQKLSAVRGGERSFDIFDASERILSEFAEAGELEEIDVNDRDLFPTLTLDPLPGDLREAERKRLGRRYWFRHDTAVRGRDTALSRVLLSAGGQVADATIFVGAAPGGAVMIEFPKQPPLAILSNIKKLGFQFDNRHYRWFCDGVALAKNLPRELADALAAESSALDLSSLESYRSAAESAGALAAGFSVSTRFGPIKVSDGSIVAEFDDGMLESDPALADDVSGRLMDAGFDFDMESECWVLTDAALSELSEIEGRIAELAAELDSLAESRGIADGRAEIVSAADADEDAKTQARDAEETLIAAMAAAWGISPEEARRRAESLRSEINSEQGVRDEILQDADIGEEIFSEQNAPALENAEAADIVNSDNEEQEKEIDGQDLFDSRAETSGIQNTSGSEGQELQEGNGEISGSRRGDGGTDDGVYHGSERPRASVVREPGVRGGEDGFGRNDGTVSVEESGGGGQGQDSVFRENDEQESERDVADRFSGSNGGSEGNDSERAAAGNIGASEPKNVSGGAFVEGRSGNSGLDSGNTAADDGKERSAEPVRTEIGSGGRTGDEHDNEPLAEGSAERGFVEEGDGGIFQNADGDGGRSSVESVVENAGNGQEIAAVETEGNILESASDESGNDAESQERSGFAETSGELSAETGSGEGFSEADFIAGMMPNDSEGLQGLDTLRTRAEADGVLAARDGGRGSAESVVENAGNGQEIKNSEPQFTEGFSEKDFFAGLISSDDEEIIAKQQRFAEESSAGIGEISGSDLADLLLAGESEETQQAQPAEVITRKNEVSRNFGAENNFVLDDISNSFNMRSSAAYERNARERWTLHKLPEHRNNLRECNVAAVTLIQRLHKEGRHATDDEKIILSQFSGWMGTTLNDFADAGRPNFRSSHSQSIRDNLERSLGTGNWDLVDAAMADIDNGSLIKSDDSSTPNEVIDSVYGKLRDFGFGGGVILEPGCGAGNFIGRLPADMKNSEVVGVEIDKTSSDIAAELYPGAEIINAPLNKTTFSKRFDAVVGSVPDGVAEENDPAVAKFIESMGKQTLGEQFISKSVMSARPGGIIALVVNSSLLDNSESKSVREAVAKNAEFLGAVRLPDGSVGKNLRKADIVFLKKRPHPVELDAQKYPDQSWISTWKITSKDFSDGVTSSLEGDYVLLGNNKKILVGGSSDLTTSPKNPNQLNSSRVEDFNREGIEINDYYRTHPDMVLGDFVVRQERHGGVTFGVKPAADGKELENLLKAGMSRISGAYSAEWTEEIAAGDIRMDDPHPEIKNGSFCVIGGELMFKRNETDFIPLEKEGPDGEREYNDVEVAKIKGYVGIRDALETMINLESYGGDHEKIIESRTELNRLYDEFFAEFGDSERGGVNNDKKDSKQVKSNVRLFERDALWSLVSSIEDFETRDVETKSGKKRKSVYVGKSAVMKSDVVSSVLLSDSADSLDDALIRSLRKFGKIDIPFISRALGGEPVEIAKNLVDSGTVFRDPEKVVTGDVYSGYVLKNEYLSGDLNKKLKICKSSGNEFSMNAEAITNVLPPPVSADEIVVTMGASWLDKKYYEEFFCEESEESQLTTGNRNGGGKFSIKKTSVDGGAWIVKADQAKKNWKNACHWGSRIGKYSTDKMFAGDLLQCAMNQKAPVVYKDVPVPTGPDGKKGQRPRDENATLEAQNKMKLMRDDFVKWLLRTPERRAEVEAAYNESMGGFVARAWDGKILPDVLPGMNNSIELREHQKKVIERQVYGGNALIAHGTGAGKTFSMIAGIMEKKRLGIAQKSVLTVPKPLVRQIATDFMRLYPAAKIKVADDYNMNSKTREKFLQDVKDGDYDCVVMSHEKFTSIPVGKKILRVRAENTMSQIRNEINSLGNRGLTEADKQMRKNLLGELKKARNLFDSVDEIKEAEGLKFEEIGIDNIVVDEAHEFKNLTFSSHCGDGVKGSAAASDMYAKTQYLNQVTDGRGVTFSTATPVSNHISEVWTMQRYLQPKLLRERNLNSFDEWACQFCEKDITLEVDVTGVLKEKMRFTNYVNLPEFAKMFGQVADVKLDKEKELKMALPTLEIHNVTLEPSNAQKAYMDFLIKRSEMLSDPRFDVSTSVDNKLKITTEGRKLALDERLIKKDIDTRIKKLSEEFMGLGMPKARAEQEAQNNVAADFPNSSIPDFGDWEFSKSSVCAENVRQIYEAQTNLGEKSTQLIFCDSSTPSEDANAFTVYKDLKTKLVAKGIPENEIAFIHDAETDNERATLFAAVSSGDIRVLIGSTSKLGTGVNVQEKLIALHHMDPTWRPSDMEQRNGRMMRPGNENANVHIYNYVTRGTLDGFMYQNLETKQDMVVQLLTNQDSRVIEDMLADQQSLEYRELKAAATGMEELISLARIDKQIALEEKNKVIADKNKSILAKRLASYDATISEENKKSAVIDEMIAIRDANRFTQDGGKDGLPNFSIKLANNETGQFETIDVQKKAGEKLNAIAATVPRSIGPGNPIKVGEYRGFTMVMFNDVRLAEGKGDKGQMSAFQPYADVKVVRLFKPGTVGDRNAEFSEIVLGAASGNIGKLNDVLDTKLNLRKEVFDKRMQQILLNKERDQRDFDAPYTGQAMLDSLLKRREEIMQKLNEKCKEREAAEKANGRGSEIDGQNANSRGCGFSR